MALPLHRVPQSLFILGEKERRGRYGWVRAMVLTPIPTRQRDEKKEEGEVEEY